MEPYASLEENILTQNSNGNGIVRMKLEKLALLLMNVSSDMELRCQVLCSIWQTNWKLASALLMSGRVDKR